MLKGMPSSPYTQLRITTYKTQKTTETFIDFIMILLLLLETQKKSRSYIWMNTFPNAPCMDYLPIYIRWKMAIYIQGDM